MRKLYQSDRRGQNQYINKIYSEYALSISNSQKDFLR